MARRRGLSNQERLATLIATVTATGAVVSAPCFVYAIHSTLNATTATGFLSIGDTTAAADLVLESTRWDMKFGTSGVSGQTLDYVPRQFMPPLYISKQLFFANSTGINSVSVQYIPAS